MYKWKEINPKITAETFGAVMEKIEQRGAAITPANVVAEARPPDSPLHLAFEWNDEKAAELYRHGQAGYYLRHIRIMPSQVKPDQQPKPHIAFVSVVRDGQRQYVATKTALNTADLRAQVVNEARRGLQGWLARYGELGEFADLIPLAQQILGKAKGANG